MRQTEEDQSTLLNKGPHFGFSLAERVDSQNFCFIKTKTKKSFASKLSSKFKFKQFSKNKGSPQNQMTLIDRDVDNEEEDDWNVIDTQEESSRTELVRHFELFHQSTNARDDCYERS